MSGNIEELPDEVLADILSRLKTKKAVRTCTVSRRWKNVWTLCRNLDLDFTNKKYKRIDVRRCVDYVFNNHQPGVDVDNLRIAFRKNDDNNVNPPDHSFLEWFKFANAKRVQILNIEAPTSITLADPPSQWAPPIPLSSWDRLTALFLTAVILTDSDVDLILSNSPNLEKLLLYNVSLTRIVVKDTNPKLKRLKIWDCALLECIDIVSVPNLESFKVHFPVGDRDIPCSCDVRFERHAPKLGFVNLGGPRCRNMMLKLQEFVPRLQKLKLDMDVDCKYCWGVELDVPILINLKQLELRFTFTNEVPDHDVNKMNVAIQIISSCPGLEKLTLKYEIQNSKPDYFSDVDDYPGGLYNQSHECLKKVEVVGWSGFKSEVRFVRYLIHSSPNLEHLVLDPTPTYQTETRWFDRFYPMPKMKWQFDHAARVAQELIDHLHKRQQTR